MRRSVRSEKPNNKVQVDSFTLKGGLNLVDPPIEMPSGMLLAATNYELLPRGGYHRIDGFERSDGQPRPSDATYWILNYDTGDIATPVVDSLVIGQTSGAIGKVGIIVLTSGTWAGSDALGYVAIYSLSGIFEDDEPLSFSSADPAFSHGFSSGFS
jgi:hypothetical protein